MASAGFLGALGGFGEGLNQVGKINRESELINERAALDEARDIARERFRAGLVTAENIRLEGVRVTATDVKTQADVDAAAIKTQADVDAAAIKATGDATQYTAEIAGRTDVANINAASRENVAGLKGGGTNRYSFTSTTRLTSDGEITEHILLDKASGTAYSPEGDKFWAPSTPLRAAGKSAPGSAVAYLNANPQTSNVFESKYGYLPKAFAMEHIINPSTAEQSPVATPGKGKTDKPKSTKTDKPKSTKTDKSNEVEPTIAQPPKTEETKAEQSIARAKKGVTLSDDALGLAFRQAGAKTMAEKLAVIRDIKKRSLGNRISGANLLASK